MRILNCAALAAAAGSLLLLAACGGNAPQPNAESTAQQTEAVTESTTVTETTAETTTTVAYFDQCREMLSEYPPEDLTEMREGVEYPSFVKLYYDSQTAGRETGLNVLLPPDYTVEKEYPVLYVLHGSGDTEDWMAGDMVQLSVILNNLTADGLAREMIVVSPYIYCSREMPRCTGLDAQNFLNFDNFINDLELDIMPFMEAHFSVAKGPENTAITGFSLGGRESLYIGFSHPEQFGYIGSICPASGVITGTGEPHTMEREDFCFRENVPELLLLSCADQDGAVGDIPYQYEEALNENGVAHLFHEMHGYSHNVESVKAHLYNFLRMIFPQAVPASVS